MRWNPALAVGIPHLDDQHKMLIHILQDIYEACSRGEGSIYLSKGIAFLEWYVQKHFNDEEQIQKDYNYPRLKEHSKMHEGYVKELKQLTFEIQNTEIDSKHIAKVIAYLNKLIQDHISVEDKSLAHFIKYNKMAFSDYVPLYCERGGLTGLYLKGEIEDMMKECMDAQKPFIYGVLQIDGFNEVNLTYGYEMGNEALIYVSGILSDFEDSYCKLGYCEEEGFLVLIDGNDVGKARKLLEQMKQKVYEGFKRRGSIIPLAISGGVVVINEMKSVSCIAQKAHVALSVAHKDGGNKIVFYEKAMHAMIIRKLDLINQLQPYSLEEHLYVVYQPIYNITSGKVEGCEALLRMRDRNGQFVSPIEFIPLAEKNKLIDEIGRFCMHEVCKMYMSMKCIHDSLKYISINLSMEQLKSPYIAEEMNAIAKTYGIDLSYIYFELTESMIMENIERIQDIISVFKSYGSKILLDDFGSGYSALAYLQHLDIDILKIDKSFLKGLGTNPKAAVVLRNVIRLAKELQIKTVVEGVETQEELEKIKALGVASVQGFYISKPLENQVLCSTIGKIEGKKRCEAST